MPPLALQFLALKSAGPAMGPHGRSAALSETVPAAGVGPGRVSAAPSGAGARRRGFVRAHRVAQCVEWRPTPVVALAPSPDGCRVAAARESGDIEIWSTCRGTSAWALEQVRGRKWMASPGVVRPVLGVANPTAPHCEGCCQTLLWGCEPQHCGGCCQTLLWAPTREIPHHGGLWCSRGRLGVESCWWRRHG